MSDSFTPPVAIIIPVYNGSNYLNKAIDSALAQDYANIEIIVINDGSDDDGKSEQIALSYSDRIRYFSKPNGGVASALNYGIRKMNGEYFSWLSHDDKYLPNKISAQISHLSRLEDKTTPIYSGRIDIDSNDKEINRVLPWEMYTKKQLEIPLFALFHGQVSGCCMLIHKSHFERVGFFDESLATTQDVDMWFRIMRNTQSVCCRDALIMNRMHDGQGTRTIKSHSSACDDFWLNVMKQLTEQEKINIGGSLYDFYNNMCRSLAFGSRTKKYAKNEALNELRKSRNRISFFIQATLFSISNSTFLFREFVISLKRNGLVKSLKRVAIFAKRLLSRQ